MMLSGIVVQPCLAQGSRVQQGLHPVKSTRSSSFSPPRHSVAVSKALPDPAIIYQIAEEAAKPGSVDAPIGVIIGLAVVVSAASLLVFSFGLKPGTLFSY